MKKLLLAALLAVSCTAAFGQGKVTLGVVTALTGPLAAPGKFQVNGFRLAEEEINKAGGIQIGNQKVTVELKIYDTRGNPSEGASAMQRLAPSLGLPRVS